MVWGDNTTSVPQISFCRSEVIILDNAEDCQLFFSNWSIFVVCLGDFYIFDDPSIFFIICLFLITLCIGCNILLMFDFILYCATFYICLLIVFDSIFIRPSLRLDVLWYTNVRLSVRPFHMSHSNIRTPWPIHFKFHRVIGIDGLTVCILYGEISLQPSYCYWNR
jgi:hypothetical protein